jgi:hypothetical protein
MQGDVMPKKNEKSEGLIQITVKVDKAFIARLDALAPRVSTRGAGTASRADVMRALMLKAMTLAERSTGEI